MGYLREIITSEALAFWLASVGVSVISLASFLITLSAIAINKKEEFSLSIIDNLGLRKDKTTNIPLLLYTAYVFFLITTIWIVRPFTLDLIIRPDGTTILTPIYYNWYLIALLILLLFFIVYPVRLMILESGKAHSLLASKTLIILPVCWAGAGISLMVFSGYLRFWGVEISSAGYLFSSAYFVITAYFFRRTTLLESFFEEPLSQDVPRVKHSGFFSESLKVKDTQLLGKKMLLEFEPSSGYGTLVKQFVEEILTSTRIVIVITRKGSPIYLALSDQSHIKILCLTNETTYPKKGASDRELIIPQNDPSIILGAIHKVQETNQNTNSAVIFDNISDFINSYGIERTYKLLANSLELLSNPNVTALYLLNSSAHDVRIVSTIRGSFSTHIVHNEKGPKIVKHSI